MSTDQIRETIALAVDHEQRSGQLLLSFEQNLESLRSSLLLPGTDAPARLVSFVQRYIEYVPEFLDGIGGACSRRKPTITWRRFCIWQKIFSCCPHLNWPRPADYGS